MLHIGNPTSRVVAGSFSHIFPHFLLLQKHKTGTEIGEEKNVAASSRRAVFWGISKLMVTTKRTQPVWPGKNERFGPQRNEPQRLCYYVGQRSCTHTTVSVSLPP